MGSETSSSLNTSPSFASRITGALLRAKSFVFDPEGMWPIVKAEEGDEKALYRNFIIIMAAIPPLAQLIGAGILGGQGVGTALNIGFVSYLIGLLSLYLLALVLERLAPLFGGKPSRLDCLKLLAYSYSASYLAGILTIIPWAVMAIISGLLSLYSLYILYSGISVMTGVSEDRRLGFFATSILASIVVIFALGVLTAPIFMSGASSVGGV